MLKQLRVWLARGAASGSPVEEGADDIPRYPPFARGLPAVPADRLLEGHADLLAKIRLAVGMPATDYQRIIAPVIGRYAAFVHLLPASQAHHHRGAGGLLAHGLEVAYHALCNAEDVLFTAREEPGRRRELEPRWRVAAALAGLAHDVGKPVSGLSVTDRDGTRTWKPYRQDVVQWAREEGVERYFLHWRAGRHRTHEVMASLVMERVFTDACKDWLAAHSDEILEAMLCAIVAPDRGSRLGPLVLKADNASVEIDLRRHGNLGEDSWGVPVERYVMDAMRRLVAGKWTVNRPGARVWLFREGLYVVWRQAADEIVELLRGDRVPGVPRDADTLADILISRDLAVPRETPEGVYRYWPMSPAALARDGKEVRLLMLRLSAPQLLFDEPPALVAGGIHDSKAPEPRSPRDDNKPRAEANTPPDRPAKGRDSKPVKAGAATITGQNNQAQQVAPVAGPERELPEAPGNREAGPRAAPFPAGAPAPEAEGVSGPEARATDVRAQTADAKAKPRPEPGSAIEASLAALAVAARWDETAHWRPPHVVLAYPDAFAAGGEPARLLADLDAAGALARDPLRPRARLRRHQGVQGALLTEAASAIFRAAAGPMPGNARARAAPPRAAATAEPDAIAGDLVGYIRARDGSIPGGVTESGEGLIVRQMVVGWFAAQRGISGADLRAALARRRDVELLGAVRMRITGQPPLPEGRALTHAGGDPGLTRERDDVGSI